MNIWHERAILRLVDVLYSCVDGESLWASFLEALVEHLGASVIGITTNSSLQAVVGVDPAELARYQNYYLRINPWLADPRSYPEGNILLTEEVLPAGIYRKTQFYNEWGKRNLVTHSVGGAIRVNGNSYLFLSINRGDVQGPFGEQEREIAKILMPHLQRAVSLYERMSGLNGRDWVLDAVTFPMMFVASDGTVEWANHAAERLLRQGRGLRFRDGKISAELPEENSVLHKKLREDRSLLPDRVNGYGGWVNITRADDLSQLSLLLARPPHALARQVGVAETASGFLVFVAAQSVDANALASRLRRSWSLTPAEAALAIEMIEADGLPSAAAKLAISRNTAKTQLASIFQKSGARRQGELVRKLLALSAIVVAPPKEP